MRMEGAEIGGLYFTRDRMGDDRNNMEVRETFYRRTPHGNALLGLAQGNAELEVPQYDDEGRLIRPRYIRFSFEGHEYPLVPSLPVYPISQSLFYQYCIDRG